ncbi:chaperone protein DNAj, putative [Trypanosoma equiperdum]|uniref:Chaperone protein DNAJ, putative n=2 Tax=Trypanozoon TaxID=39700 RepID=Q387E9_TRYB2|nr:chaperone protein DnaJ [Trypanosoma brucei brucei TREU927]EAN79082.1 chaperone protein DNAJ, putative [Trypanosoma brucei brucei TREU927]SCU67042.1 chaperone protein DNAj, putative [Trypanosoma equiperdum]
MRRFVSQQDGKATALWTNLPHARVSSAFFSSLTHESRVVQSVTCVRRVLAPPTPSIYPAFRNTFKSTKRWQGSTTSAGGDYYKLLGVKPDASQDEIKAAYKKLALEFHPDRNHDPGAEEMFKNISEAYNIIGNKTRRKEYDMQRRAETSNAGSARSSYHPGGAAYHSPPGYQHISKEEADKIFRDLFGGMRVDQIFRDFEEMQRGTRSGGRSGFPQEFGAADCSFRPSFRSESTRVYTDGLGNRMEERTFTDSHGNTYTVHTTTSEQPNASMNQRAEDYYSGHASNSGGGRFRMGNSSFRVTPRDAANDFGANYFGIRTHGRHPAVAMMILVAWSIVLGTLLFATLAFFVSHPFFTFAVLFLILLKRMRLF